MRAGVRCFFTGRPGLRTAQPCRYCIYSVVQNGFFAPQGRHIAPMNVKFGRGERTVIGTEMWEYSPQNRQNFEFCLHICPPPGGQRLYASVGRFKFKFGRFLGTNNQVISIFPQWRHFPHKRSIADLGFLPHAKFCIKKSLKRMYH